MQKELRHGNYDTPLGTLSSNAWLFSANLSHRWGTGLPVHRESLSWSTWYMSKCTRPDSIPGPSDHLGPLVLPKCFRAWSQGVGSIPASCNIYTPGFCAAGWEDGIKPDYNPFCKLYNTGFILYSEPIYNPFLKWVLSFTKPILYGFQI